MSTCDNIRFTVEAGVACLTLDRPQTLNALTMEMMSEAADALQRIEGDGAIRVLILTGSGHGFCSGQDLNSRLPPGVDIVTALMDSYHKVFAAIRCCRVPVIVAINGVAAGGGCSLALAGDIAIGARSARFIQVFSRIGLAPDLGSTYLLPRVVGRARALKMMLTGEPVSAEQALAMGMITACVDDDQLMPEALKLAHRLAKGPTRAFAMTRQLVDEAERNDFDRQFRRELEVNQVLRESKDSREGVAAFLEKRAARFNGE